MSLRPRVRTSAPTSAHGSVEQRLWAPVRVALTIGGPGAPYGRSHTSGPSLKTQLPDDALMKVVEALTKLKTPKEMCVGINHFIAALSLTNDNEIWWRQVVDMLHLPPSLYASDTTEPDYERLPSKQIFTLWCDDKQERGKYASRHNKWERIMHTWIHFIEMYKSYDKAPELKGARESLLFCMDRYGGWADWKQAVGALWKLRDYELLKWFLEQFFLRDNFAQRRAGMREELLGHALSKIFKRATVDRGYLRANFPNPYKVLFASLLQDPFKFTLGDVTYAILRDSVETYRMREAALVPAARINTFVAQNTDMLNYWMGDIPGKLRFDALLELMQRFESTFNGIRGFLHIRGLCIPLHFFISTISPNAIKELNEATKPVEPVARQWRSLLDWSQGFADPDDVFTNRRSLPEWFH